MLTQLKVYQYAIVDEIELELTPGLSIISGETGAGKSILIDALSLALGARTDPSSVRNGAKKAEIIAHFDCSNNTKAQQWLQQRDLDGEDGCLLRRTIFREGRSKAYINGLPCTAQDLKSLGNLLVDIHGQHEHQNLLNKDSQLELLDQYGNLNTLGDRVAAAYQSWHTCHTELQLLKTNAHQEQAQADLLNYQLKEIQELNLAPDEVQKLEQEHKRISNLDQLQHNCQQTLTYLNEGEEFNILSALHQSQQLLEPYRADNPALNNAGELLAQASILLQESSDEIRLFQDSLEISPEQVALTEERLSACHQIARKHHIKATELYAHQQKLSQQLSLLGNPSEKIAQLETQAQQHLQQFQDLAMQLSEKRKKVAKRLKKLISEKMAILGMPKGQFEVQFNPRTQPHKNGSEQVEFYVSTNPGQAPQALNKVASGGELSRISLAIQVILAEKADTPTLFFDEVDVGVGGGVAEIIGKTLRQLGSHSQIICVTHLPQVAAQGHQHFAVEKQHQKNSTKTLFTKLDEKKRITEIARMLGGVELTEQTLAHAKEMLQAEA